MRRSASQRERKLRLEFVPLESRALLSSGLTPSISTDQSVYQPGQPIHIQFTETNNTSLPIET